VKVGDLVAWRWLNGIAEGEIAEIHHSRHEIITKGKRIIRNGTLDNPAIVIKHTSGTEVLKFASEIQVSTR
jgi:hypothetical protein